MKNVVFVASLILALAIGGRSYAQSSTGITLDTGAMIVNDLGLNHIVAAGGVTYPGIGGTAIVAGFATWIGTSTLNGVVDTSAYGTNAAGSANAGFTVSDITVGATVSYAYKINTSDMLVLEYTVHWGLIAGGTKTNTIETNIPASLVTGSGGLSPSGFAVVGTVGGTHQGRSGSWVTVQIPYNYGYMNWSDGVYYVVAGTTTVTYFVTGASREEKRNDK